MSAELITVDRVPGTLLRAALSACAGARPCQAALPLVIQGAGVTATC
jgi:hypothetical protein